MVAALQQLQSCSLLQAAGGRGLLAAAGSRLAHSAAGGSSTRSGSGSSSREEEGKRVHHGVPASLPEVPPRWRPTAGSHQLSLASINDPETWGLTSSGSAHQEERGAADGYYWLGSSLSNPKEPGAPLARPSSPQRSPSTLAPQGFRTAVVHQAVQRKVVFRSSMIEPELPFSFRSSMMDPPLRQPDRS